MVTNITCIALLEVLFRVIRKFALGDGGVRYPLSHTFLIKTTVSVING